MPHTSGKPRTPRSNILFAFVLALACYLAWTIRDVLVLLYVSALFAVAVSPLVRATASLRIGRWQPFKGTAILILILGAAGALALFGYLALPPVISDLQTFSGEMPKRVPALLAKFRQIPFVDRLNASQIGAQLQSFGSQAASYLLASIGNWAGKLFNIVMGFILTVYFILEGDGAYRWFLSFLAPQNRERLDRTLQRAEVRMGHWLLGQGSLMLILGVASTIVYLLLRVRYPFALGVLAGLLNIIPVIGAAASIALALLVASIDSWSRVVGVAIFYVVYVQVENSYLIPRIMNRTVNLPGLAILVALLLGSALEGVLGAMVSVPTAVLVAVLVDEYLVNKEPA